jgi:hypothetical protein
MLRIKSTIYLTGQAKKEILNKPFVPARHRLRLRRGGRVFVPSWQIISSLFRFAGAVFQFSEIEPHVEKAYSDDDKKDNLLNSHKHI